MKAAHTLFLLAILTAILCNSARAATEIRVYSEDGDFAGNGGTYIFPGDAGTWILEGDPQFVTIRLRDVPTRFSFHFNDYTIPKLVPGRYEVEYRDSRLPPAGPYMQISGGNTGCNNTRGYFEIF